MNNRGFSLIELLTIIALIGILSALATFGFSQYSRKSRITNQTRALYGDLMEYRLKALYEKRNWSFKFSGTGYGIYSSVDTTVTPVSTVVLQYPIEFNTTYVKFDSQGLTNNSGTICVSSANDAVVDSVVISKTRIKLGKKEGTDCVADNINAK